MEKVALSNANLRYLNSTIKKAQENINLEKSITQPAPNTNKPQEEQKKINAKGVTIIGIAAALILSVLYGLTKSKTKNTTDDAIIKELKEQIESLQSRIADLTENAKAQKTPISEIKSHGKDYFELTYVDGKLIQSKKFDKDGNELFRKLFHETIEDNGDEIIVKRSVERYDNSPIQRLFRSTTRKSKNDKTILKRCFNTFEINTDTKEAKETTKFAQNQSGLQFLKTNSKKGDIAVKKRGEDKAIVEVISEGFKYIEEKLSFIKEGFKSYIINPKINPKD